MNSVSESKIKFQWVILVVGIVLFVIKFLAFWVTNSVGILSDALESTVNIITAIITLISLKFAALPRDDNHPYGHGKLELITASIEAILIVLAGIIAIHEAVKRFGNPPEVLRLDFGILLLVFTVAANGVMGWLSIKWGRAHHSAAIETGGKHLLTDSVSSVALILGLVIFYVTKMAWLDSFIAIIFGIAIIVTGIKVLISTSNSLMDEANPLVLNKIGDVLIENRRSPWVNIHRLTYLGYGSIGHVDFHLTLPFYYTLQEAQSEIVHLKSIVKDKLDDFDLDISIQSEPCDTKMCDHCIMDKCKFRIQEFKPDNTWKTAALLLDNKFKLK